MKKFSFLCAGLCYSQEQSCVFFYSMSVTFPAVPAIQSNLLGCSGFAVCVQAKMRKKLCSLTDQFLKIMDVNLFAFHTLETKKSTLTWIYTIYVLHKSFSIQKNSLIQTEMESLWKLTCFSTNKCTLQQVETAGPSSFVRSASFLQESWITSTM